MFGLLQSLLRKQAQGSSSTSPYAVARLRIGRIVCLLAVALIPVFGVLYGFTVPQAVDPMGERVLVASVPLGLWAASYVSAWVRTHFVRLAQGLAYLLLAWFVLLAARNGFSASYAVGLLFTTAVLEVAMLLLLDRLGPMVAFCSVAVLAVAALLWGAPPAPISEAVLITCLIGVALVTCVALVLRLQVGQLLEEKEERNRAVLTQTTEGVFLADAGTLAILETNPAYRRLLGYAPGQLRERTLREVAPEAEGGLLAHIEQFRRREHFIGDTRHRRKDGTLVEVELSADLIRYGGQEVICAVVRDIRARKETERALRHSQKRAEQALRAKSALLDNMSHELRTPLATIMGYAEVLAEEAEAPRHREFARSIEEGGRRLQALLNTVLELARLEGGEVTPEPRPLDLPSAVRTVVEEERPAAEQKALALEMTAAPQHLSVHMDRHSLQQVLRPLLDNAVKFTGEGAVSVRVKEDGEMVYVCVSDTGPGLPRECASQLFEAFEQESSGLTRTHQGMGLGLAVARRHAQLMGGSLEVERTSPEGTTFCLRLPKRPPAPAASAAACVPSEASHSGGRRMRTPRRSA